MTYIFIYISIYIYLFICIRINIYLSIYLHMYTVYFFHGLCAIKHFLAWPLRARLLEEFTYRKYTYISV